MTSRGEPKKTKMNLPWILGTLLIGGAVLSITIAAADSSAQTGLWQSALINIGSAVALSSLLGFIEPRLRKNYIEATTRKIEAATEEIEARVDARVEELEERVESSQALFRQYMDAEDEAVVTMSGRPDFYTIAGALVAANRARTIDPFRGVTVPASEGIPSVVVGFHYATPVGNGRRDVLRIKATVLEDRPDGRFPWPTEYAWQPGATSEQFGAYMMKELQNADLKDVASKVFWPETIDRLTTALTLAFDSKRNDGKLKGQLIEMGPGNWALTSVGIEHVYRGILAPADSFPSEITGAVQTFARRGGEVLREPWMDLERPEWAEPAEWEYMIARARKVLANINLPVMMQPPYVGSTKEPRRPGPRASGVG
ncbi:hypothetical protein ACFFGR_13435 [Arthrobacter liuii]|uniref:Uncharacterized protein n=1 Tax=Arthrobacter liuii TaxID=1476996 RepID=A0ABQ2AZ99_9MICC|nr:hypothetical protein [Arthrobacter liuii]GGI00372.1 hypothetical protein GCM10007170_37360 [Arthrobacter liuii]